jgi:glucokinase
MNKKGRIVLTLDAGGTNFVFSAVQSNEWIVEPLSYPSSSDDLGKCLGTLVKGFEETMKRVPGRVDAISFAFPGPADYDRGIIGDLPNFKAFNDQVAMGPMLEEKFGLLLKGDNSCDSGVHLVPDKFNTNWGAEESVSTRSIQRVYAEVAGRPFSAGLMPRDIYEISTGKSEGDQSAAVEAFRRFGEGLGNAVAGLLTLIDGIVVIGGGIASAWDQFAPAMFQEIERKFETFDGHVYSRLPFKVYNLENEEDFEEFAGGQVRSLGIPGSDKTIDIDALPRVGIGISRIGASKAISLGAYAYANQQMDALS